MLKELSRDIRTMLMRGMKSRNVLVISDAYVYTKSNHIENQVAKHLENFVKYIKENAGPSWKYLKFIFNMDEEKNNIMFILKNEDYFDEKM